MPLEYTPTATFDDFPVDVPADGDPGNFDTLSLPIQDLLDRSLFLNNNASLLTSRFNNSLTKLGITVVDESDTELPTYSNPFALTGNRSHQNALEALDASLKTVDDTLAKLNTNLGGNVRTANTLTYASTNFITNGLSHHAAIEQLDTSLNSVSTTASANNTAINTGSTRVNFLTANLGTDTDIGNIAYSSNNLINDGDSYQTVAVLFDKLVNARKRNSDFIERLAFENLASNQSAEDFYVENFQNTTQVDASNTATIDVLNQTASGNGNIYVATFTLTGNRSQAYFKVLDDAGTGSIVYKFNLIGSLLDSSMTTVTGFDQFITAAAPGSTLVVRAEITGDAKINFIGVLAKT